MFKRSISAAVVAAFALVLSPGVAHARLANAPQTHMPQFNGDVNTVDKRGSTLYIGGSFTSVTDRQGRTHARRGAAAVNASTGAVLRWNPNVSGEVRDIEAYPEGVYLAGDFSRVKSSARKNLARVNGTTGAVHKKFKVRTNRPVESLALSKSRIYFAGEFSKVGRKNRAQAAAVTRSGLKLTGWSPKARNGRVYELVRRGANIYVAGEFRELNGAVAHQRLALVDGKRGRTIGRFNPRVDKVIFDIDVTSSRVYAAMGGPRGGEIFAVNTTSGRKSWERRVDGDAQSVKLMGGELFAGGHFSAICPNDDQSENGTCFDSPVQRERGASFNPANGSLTSWTPNANGIHGITELAAIGGGRLAAGGDFTDPRNKFAVFASVR